MEQQGVVHIVTSESAAGTLRVGLERPKTVIGFPDCFSIGLLWKLDEKAGQIFRNEWLYENINFEMDDNVYENKFKNTLREIEDIPEEVPIHIWYANNADEQIGLRFYLYLLRNKGNEIFLVNATELNDGYSTPKDKEQEISHIGQMEPQNLRLRFEQNKLNKPILVKDRIQFQKEWEPILQTKEVLRLWKNDEIKGVPEDYYDPVVINTIEKLHNEQVDKDFINTGQVIGEIVMQSGVFVSIFFLEYRVRYLIYSGILELKEIPKSMRHYGVRLR